MTKNSWKPRTDYGKWATWLFVILFVTFWFNIPLTNIRYGELTFHGTLAVAVMILGITSIIRDNERSKLVQLIVAFSFLILAFPLAFVLLELLFG